MKIKYLGSGAAERIPAIFCNCRICQNAREKGGKELRTQSQFILDDQLLIDFPGDSYLHLLQHDLDFTKFNHLLLSHWHSDHFYGEDLAYRMSTYANEIENCLIVYGNETVKQFYDRAFVLENQTEPERLNYVTIKPYEKFQLANYTIHPLPAQHGWFKKDCFIFAISDGKDTFLSTHDSGYFTDEMFHYLSKQQLTFSIVSLDCTGQTHEQTTNHMNWSDNLKMIAELKRRGLVTPKTCYVANHFSHNGGLTHDEMEKLSQSQGIITSYDGLEIDTAKI